MNDDWNRLAKLADSYRITSVGDGLELIDTGHGKALVLTEQPTAGTAYCPKCDSVSVWTATFNFANTATCMGLAQSSWKYWRAVVKWEGSGCIWLAIPAVATSSAQFLRLRIEIGDSVLVELKCMTANTVLFRGTKTLSTWSCTASNTVTDDGTGTCGGTVSIAPAGGVL